MSQIGVRKMNICQNICYQKLGGGVLLTSIHEINYTISLFGKVDRIQAQKITNNNKLRLRLQ